MGIVLCFVAFLDCGVSVASFDFLYGAVNQRRPEEIISKLLKDISQISRNENGKTFKREDTHSCFSAML